MNTVKRQAAKRIMHLGQVIWFRNNIERFIHLFRVKPMKLLTSGRAIQARRMSDSELKERKRLQEGGYDKRRISAQAFGRFYWRMKVKFSGRGPFAGKSKTGSHLGVI
jgi:hypothetical protein